MGSGFDGLLDFLLEKIALCGEQGASLEDYKRFVDQFYSTSNANSTPSSGTEQPSQTQPILKADARLQAKIWKWLTSHPEIWVGQNREGNKLSLSEIEAKVTSNSSTNTPGFDRPVRQTPSIQQENSIGSPEPNSNLAHDTESSSLLRIWTTRDRVWQAVAGHGVDFKRIPPLEFKALCFIAAAGEKGIAQPELVRLSGQDKRSLPKRTDNLHTNGYIDKAVVYVKPHKTSLLRLKRFVQSSSSLLQNGEAAKSIFADGRLILDNLLDCLCEWLKNDQFLPMVDLEEMLSCRSKSWEKRTLWRSLERLDIVGVIQRFRRPIQVQGPKGSARTIRPKCVRLLREPTVEDRQRYHSLTVKDRDAFRRRLEAQDAEAREEHVENEEDDDYVPEEELVQGISATNPSAQLPARAFRPQWDPDIPYTNFIFKFVEQAGHAGISTMDLRARTYGDFYFRPVDQMLGRLTDDWASAQPSHLRHLGVIRDTGTMSRFTHYLYRTYDNFQIAVNNLQTSWEVVSSSQKKNANSNARRLDDWGFPILESRHFLRDGRGTLAECLASAHIPAQSITTFDPVLAGRSNGSTEVVWPQNTPRKAGPRPKVGRKPSLISSALGPIKSGQDSDLDPAEARRIYNANYRRMQRQRMEAEQRENQIRLQAERMAYEEALAQSISTFPKVPDQGLITPLFKPRRNKPSFAIAGKAGYFHVPASKEVVEMSENHVAEESAANSRQSVVVLETRIQEFISQLKDTSRRAVHINPPGSRPEQIIGHGKPYKQQMVVVFKYPWLKDLEWFVQTPAPEPPASTPERTIDLEADHGENIEVGAGVVAEQDAPASEPGSLNTEDDEPEPTTLTRKYQRKEKKLAAPGVYRKKQRGRPPKERRSKLEIIIRSDRLKELPMNTTGPVDNETNPDSNSLGVAIPSTETGVINHENLPAELHPTSDCHLTNSASKRFAEAAYAPSPKRTRIDGPDKTVAIGENAGFTMEQSLMQVPVVDVTERLQESAAAPAVVDDQETESPAILDNEFDTFGLRTSNFKRLDRKKKGLALGAGTVRLKRTQLVMQIVEKSGGVFPGDSEIVGPYQKLQQQSETGKTDRDTILKAVKSLVDMGKLKRIGFAFHSENGRIITKHILLRPDIMNNSPEAQKMIQNIQDAYPRNFVPPEFEETPSSSKQKQTKNISRFLYEENVSVVQPYDGTKWVMDFEAKRKELEQKRLAQAAQERAEEEKRRKAKIERNRERQKNWYYRHKDEPNFRPWFRRGTSSTASASSSRRPHGLEQEDTGMYDDQEYQPMPSTPEPTLAELLAGAGSFATPSTNEYQAGLAGYVEPDDVIPSIENDFEPSTPSRGRRRPPRPGRVSASPFQDDYWVHEDPSGTTSRPSARHRSGSVYSQDGPGSPANLTDAQRERRLSTASLDNALNSTQKTMDFHIRKRPRFETSASSKLYGMPMTHPKYVSNQVQSAVYHRSFLPHAPRRSDTRRKGQSRAILVHDVLTFKHTGPQDYDRFYEWQDMPAFLDPDQRFHLNTGTFSTDFFVRRNVRTSRWVEPPTLAEFENVSSSKEKDIETFVRTDDHDAHFHPDKKPKKRGPKARRQMYDSDDSDADEIEQAWFERQELEAMREQYPGLAFGRKQDGFFNFSMGHQQEMADVDQSQYRYRPGDRVMMYGAPSQVPPSDLQVAPPPRPHEILPNRGYPGYDYSIAQPPTDSLIYRGQYRPIASRNAVYDMNGSTVPFDTSISTRAPTKQSGDCTISPAVARRLLYAVVAVRTLAGGVDQTVRWQYITDIFFNHPNYDLPTFKNRWLRMWNNHKTLIVQLEKDFQNAFLTAYDRGVVPPFDIQESRSYDWNWITDWAMRNIPIFPEEITLPATKSMLGDIFDIEVALRNTHEQKEKMEHPLATNWIREKIGNSLEFALPLRTKKSKKDNLAKLTKLGEIHIARSWARACAATPDSAFRPEIADIKLQALDDDILREAISQLHAERMISHVNKGRMVPGRNFKIADGYNQIWKRQLENQHFVDALNFKARLDDVFSSRSPAPSIRLEPDMKDGEIFALTELLAHRRVRVVPTLPPLNSNIGDPWPRLSVWGFSEGHYRLRNLDKKNFHWGMEIEPTGRYVFGWPVHARLQSLPPPRGPLGDLSRVRSGHSDDGLAAAGELIPIWYDIHGNLLESYWANLVRCVAQALAIKAGSSMEHLYPAFKGFIWDWELELVVEWMVDIGVAKWTEGRIGAKAKEWWWTVVPVEEVLPQTRKEPISLAQLEQEPKQRRPRRSTKGMTDGYEDGVAMDD